MKTNQKTKSVAKELDLGTRKISKMNFSYIITIPKVFVKNSPFGEIRTVKIIMLEDGSLKIIPVHENDKPDEFSIM